MRKMLRDLMGEVEYLPLTEREMLRDPMEEVECGPWNEEWLDLCDYTE